jgi:hypothetical protein
MQGQTGPRPARFEPCDERHAAEVKLVSNNRWFLPAFSLFLGVVLFAAFWIGGNLGMAFAALGILVAVGLLLAFGGRSETIRGLRGDGRDERFATIDLTATAIAGTALLVAVIVGFVVEIASGHSGAPFGWLGAIAGIVYVIAVVALRLRS